ncbi:hypothetical protein [Sphingomonas sp. DT-204]|uniref:hypothetical protein n=1 Tax=Sphingomonas sp. DT-204 TaxID=3396166 RepID=UPI003F1961B3
MLRTLGLLAAGVAAVSMFHLSASVHASPNPEAAQEAPPLGEFGLEFVVLYRATDPRMALRPAGIPRTPYNVATWLAQDPARADLAGVKRAAATQGDGFDDRILNASAEARTANYFNSGEQIRLRPSNFARTAQGWTLTFPEDSRFALEAEVVTRNKPYPLICYRLKAKKPGYFSVGYVGAPAHDAADADEVWQSLIWQERRMPANSYLTLAYQATLPTALVRKGDRVYGALAAAEEFPFQPLPLADNSRFGIAVRGEDGRAQPTIFAPVLGGAGSQLKPGETTSFSFYTVAERANDITQTYEKLARDIYGFRDYRHNSIASLNTAFDNIVDYSLTEYANWIAELKGPSYSTDVPGAVKNVSSLNPLELALVADRPELFEGRAAPVIEYQLSREKFLFSLDPKQKIQDPSRALKGPAAPLSELTALYNIFGRANPLFLDLAREAYGQTRVRNLDVAEQGDRWQNALSLYLATDEKRYLDAATAGADAYLKERGDTLSKSFDGSAQFFWTGFVPDFINLFRLYEVTKERRYLDAAHIAARRYTMFTWVAPRIPDAHVTVNPGGKAPVYWYLKSKGFKPMTAPEEQVPAWRLSEIGLTPESSGTASGHRGIFMANYAPWMLRIGAETGDVFLQQVAKAATIGRYRSFPGYHINTARTNIYERADYPLHRHEELSVNSFHYNHIWPMATMLLDYLVSDAHVRSGGQIDFPAEYIEGYAYLQNRFYGHRPGRFYGDTGVQLWMPKGLVRAESVELNYVAGYRDGALYLAFANQSQQPVRSRLTLDPARVSAAGKVVKLSPAGEAVSSGDGLEVVVPAGGIAALKIEGAQPRVAFQKTLLAKAERIPNDHVALAACDARGALLGFGALGRRAFVYCRDDDSKVRSVTLSYRDAGGKRQQLTDTAYPFEFTVEGLGNRGFDFEFSAEGIDGSRKTSRGALGQAGR